MRGSRTQGLLGLSKGSTGLQHGDGTPCPAGEGVTDGSTCRHQKLTRWVGCPPTRVQGPMDCRCFGMQQWIPPHPRRELGKHELHVLPHRQEARRDEERLLRVHIRFRKQVVESPDVGHLSCECMHAA